MENMKNSEENGINEDLKDKGNALNSQYYKYRGQANLIKAYNNDETALLRDNPSLEDLYMFSAQRAGLAGWLDIKMNSNILLIGLESTALVLYLLKKAKKLYIWDKEGFFDILLKAVFNDESRLVKFEYQDGCEKKEKIKFDYIIACFNSEINPELDFNTGLSFLKEMLYDDGRLIFAVDNRYGIKYMLGADSDDYVLGKKELVLKLNQAGFDMYSLYYPVSDYRLPLSIYSDGYLPKKGDLSSDLPAYDYPDVAGLSVAQKLDEICEGDEFPFFANSFIAVSGSRPETVFVKYNRNRRDQYKICTSIEEKDGKRSVKKSALSKDAADHILSFKDKYERLVKEGSRAVYLKADIKNDPENDIYEAVFDFIEGENLSESLGNLVKDGYIPVDEINRAFEIIDGGRGTANMDAIFDNFVCCGDTLYGIDYEWVEENALPLLYTRYRALHEFFAKFGSGMGITETEFLALFDIPEENIKLYEEAEKAFQNRVHGDIQKIYLDNYRVEVKPAGEFIKMEKNYGYIAERNRVLKEELYEQSDALRKLREIKQLTDNHVKNLETIIGALRHENGELAKALAHSNARLGIPYRIKRKLSKELNRMFPKGTEGGRRLSYAKTAAENPAAYIKMLTTAEGRNILEGEKKIGEEYRLHGRLVFKKEDNPKVSIIIPVYNQIDYTYACLASILENTHDISYEIIIADDVSTDATKELSKFAENIIISRNEVNLGFLKNCNNAAKLAKGQYIMFLNNDTKVCRNWLYWLVELMDRDVQAGMAGSKLLYPDGKLQEAGGIIWSDGSGWNYGRNDDPDKCQYNYVRETDYISGAAIIIRHELWKKIGGFDERFAPAYCEDSDFAFEVRKAGYKVLYQPKSEVIHFEGVSNGTDVNGTGLKRYQVENSVKLKEKWKDEFKNQFENTGGSNIFKARERSRNRKIILFVDHYVPTFDKDAGSRTTFQYIKLLIKKGFGVKFLGDNFLREEPYTTALTQLGVEVLYGSQMQNDIKEWIRENAADIHLVYLNRPHIALKYIDFIKNHTDLKVIFYGHDLHFLREYREYELTGDKSKKQASSYWKNIELEILHKADMSYYPSQTEIQAICSINRYLAVKAITAYVYESFPYENQEDFADREGIVFVGGFAHPPNTDAVLYFVNKVWRFIREKLKINFYIVGSKAGSEITSLNNPDEGIIVKGFVSDEELERLYKSCRLAVVPLRYGAGVKGKVIEAVYHGVPVVTTEVGAEGIPEADKVMRITGGSDKKDALSRIFDENMRMNEDKYNSREDKADSDVIKDGTMAIDGSIAGSAFSQDDYDAVRFADTVIKLYENVNSLNAMSRACGEYIRKYHSIDAVWDIIKDDFE